MNLQFYAEDRYAVVTYAVRQYSRPLVFKEFHWSFAFSLL